MKPTLNEKLIAYLALLSGLSISAVAVYYSVAGLTAIFAAAVVPIIIMGTTLEISKLVATVWLKQNWKTAAFLIKAYLLAAIAVLMLITSIGIFGFLSKAHSDQGLVSGDVLAKIAVYDEKIKTAKENIDANRKALKQMDEAVDQSMARSTTETGADKAVTIRRGQAKERSRLQSEIAAEQKAIGQLSEERAPIAAEVRKVEAEVGPIKYIATFFYGDTDPTILEKAVTWVIITLIVVFDPLAVILLLASQISFQSFRERELNIETQRVFDEVNKWIDSGEALATGSSYHSEPDPSTLTDNQIKETVDNISTTSESSIVAESILETTPATTSEQPFDFAAHPYLFNAPGDATPPGIDPIPPQVYTPVNAEVTYNPQVAVTKRKETRVTRTKVFPKRGLKPVIADTPLVNNPVPTSTFGLDGYIQNEEQTESNLWTTMNPEEFINSSQKERDDHIANIVAAVKARTMEMSDVPELLQNDVKARV